MGGGRSGTLDGYYRVREVQSGPPLGPSRSKGSEAACRLSSGSSRRSKCPLPRFVRGGRAAGRRRSVPNGDSRRVGVVESSRSTRARRGSVDVSVVMFGDLLGSKRRSKPSKMSDRSASLRACSATASGRKSFPRSAGSPGSAETRTTPATIVAANAVRPSGVCLFCCYFPPARNTSKPRKRRAAQTRRGRSIAG
jgi:hypothetical protein